MSEENSTQRAENRASSGFRLFRKYIIRIPTEFWWHFGPPFLFILAAFIFFPIREQFQFDNDEGVNLMIAYLVDQDFDLYSEIWSDQPPVFTYLLVGVFRLAGYRVGAARGLVLILSAALIWAAVQYLRLGFGKKVGAVGAILIALLPMVMVLSVSVMVGLPSLSFATIALLGIGTWHRKRKGTWLAVSAVAMAVSFTTKLFSGFLAPIFVAGLLISEFHPKQNKSIIRRLWPAILWGSVFTLVSAVLLYRLVGMAHLNQLVTIHLAGRNFPAFEQEGLVLHRYLRNQAPLFILALIGCYLSYRKRSWFFLYPMAWMVSAYLLLFNHSPVWSHQQILITLPAAMLAAVAIVDLAAELPDRTAVRSFFRSKSALAVVGIFAFVLLIFDFHLPDGFENARLFSFGSEENLLISNEDDRILSDVSNYAGSTTWMVTDSPMFAFRARLNIPPNLVVLSIKRFRTGDLTEGEIIAAIESYRPEQILLGRTDYAAVIDFLQEDYVVVREEGFGTTTQRLFIRSDLLP